MLLAALSILWTWPLVLHLQDHIPGLPGDNYSFLWNLWWMRKALSAPELGFFQSQYLFSPFGVDLDQPSAHGASGLSERHRLLRAVHNPG